MFILVLLGVAVPTPIKPVWLGRIGTYRLIKWTHSEPEQETVETLFLKDPRGRIVARIHGFHVSPLCPDQSPMIRDLDHDGVPEVVLTTWSGGAYASFTHEIWSLGSRPHCMLAYDKGDVSDEHDFDFVDLDGDGVPEIRSWYDGLANTVGGANWHHLPVVLKLERGCYVDRTSRFPMILREAARNEWRDLRSSDMKTVPESWGGPSPYAINLLALADLSGTLPRTWHGLKENLPARTYAWLKKREPSILAIARARKYRYAYPPAYSPNPVDYPLPPHYETIYGVFEQTATSSQSAGQR